MRTLGALGVVVLLAPLAAAQERGEDEEKAAQERAEARLLKKARRLAEDGEAAPAWQAFNELYRLAAQHGNPRMQAQALEEARGVAQNEANELWACRTLGHLYMTQNEHVKSVKAYRRACKLAPEEAGLWNSLGYSLHLAGNEEESISAFEQCLELDRGNKEARYSIGVSYRLAGEPEKARRAHEWLVEHKDELTGGWYFAFESAERKKTGKGLDMTSHASRKAVVELEVAIDEVFLEEFESAEKTIARLKEKVPAADLEPALDVAIDETARALEMRPQHHQLRWLLGLLHEARGEAEKAGAHLEKFLEAEKKVHALARKAREKLKD